MNISLIKDLLFVLSLCSIFLILIFVFFKIFFSIKYEKRVKSFALDTDYEEELSIVDNLLIIFKKFVLKLSKGLEKSKVLSDYSKKIDKLLIYEDSKQISGINVIAYKLMITFIVDLLYIFSLIIKFMDFNIFLLLLISIIAFFLLDIVVYTSFVNKKKLMSEQLLQAVVIMNSAFKSGKNILSVVNIVRKELPSPIKNEFDIIYKDLSYGLSVENCFERFSNRIKLEEAKYITSSLALLSKTGGNIVTVFNMIEKNFYDKLKINNELKSLTSTSNFLYKFLLILPVIFILVIICLNPSYFMPLLTNPIGYVIDFIIFVIYVVYLLIVKKVMKVDKV